MITVTDRAASALEALLVESQAAPGQGVKLVGSPDNTIGLQIDAPADGDDIVHRGDVPLLIVDKAIRERIGDATIDCDVDTVDGQTQTRFMLQRSSG
jgi:Fe-S cluster assembly iron-binding protein IscA